MEPPRVEPAPPPASPFNPAAPAPARAGCPKPLILGCLGLLVLAGLCLVGFFFYAGTHVGQLLELSLRQSEIAVDAQLPKDVTPEERQRLHQAFEAARRRAGHPTNPQEVAEASQQLQLKTLAFIRKGQAATRKDVQDLTRVLEDFARTGEAPDGR
ncbi:MAG TPA: hypothetical protein VGH73_17780 [Thermoanaerobaculia bacterium]|jgi:hypothetical protein